MKFLCVTKSFALLNHTGVPISHLFVFLNRCKGKSTAFPSGVLKDTYLALHKVVFNINLIFYEKIDGIVGLNEMPCSLCGQITSFFLNSSPITS